MQWLTVKLKAQKFRENIENFAAIKEVQIGSTFGKLRRYFLKEMRHWWSYLFLIVVAIELGLRNLILSLKRLFTQHFIFEVTKPFLRLDIICMIDLSKLSSHELFCYQVIQLNRVLNASLNSEDKLPISYNL